MSDAELYSIRDMHIRRGESGSAFELVVPELTIRRGEKVALVGSSGCGKSTLLDALSMVSRPESVSRFRFSPADERIDIAAAFSSADMQDRLAEVRRRWMGYVLQTGGLLPFLSVRDNIGISRRLLDMSNDSEVDELATELDIGDRLGRYPAQLSVGQRQRVAIARALAHNPAVVIADEPTAALDPRNADRVMELFVEQVERHGATLIVASHDIERVERFGLRCLEHDLDEVEAGLIRAEFRG